MHLVALDSQKISGFSELTLNINGIRWIWMSDAFHIHGRKLLSYGRTFHIHGKALKKSCRRMHFFCIFRAVQIMNGYNLSGKMKRAPNSDSKTHVKKQNPTSRTEIRRKSLKYLFQRHPVSAISVTFRNSVSVLVEFAKRDFLQQRSEAKSAESSEERIRRLSGLGRYDG